MRRVSDNYVTNKSSKQETAGLHLKTKNKVTEWLNGVTDEELLAP